MVKFDHSKGSLYEAAGISKEKMDEWVEEVKDVAKNFISRLSPSKVTSERVEVLYNFYSGYVDDETALKFAFLTEFLAFAAFKMALDTAVRAFMGVEDEHDKKSKDKH